jgi:RNA polymerase I-specific transcription initiation factor RRN3
LFSAITDENEKNMWLYKHQQKQNRIHRSIQNIVHIVPTAQLELFPLCQEYFPHKRHHALIQTEYISQLLTLCVHFPSLQLKIFDVIVAKCLEVDVEIVIEESGDVLICKDEEAAGLFDDADDDDDMFALDDNQDPHGNTNKTAANFPRGGIGSLLKVQIQARDEVTEMADKLDSMLCVVLKFLLQHISDATATQDRIFTQFFNIFETRILSTYKSKFVQYIIFILCKNHPQRGENPNNFFSIF